MEKDFDKILDFVKKEDVHKLARDLIDIPSPMGSEQKIGEYLLDTFASWGLKTYQQEVEQGRFNVIGILEGTGGGPTLMYSGHMDTPWAGDEEGIMELGGGYYPKSYLDGDWIYGLGAYNMKSGDASAIAALKALSDSRIKLKGDVMFAAVVGETSHAQVGRYQGARYRGDGVGAHFLVGNGILADFCIDPEPTTSRISIASGGYVYLEVKILGNPGATYVRGGAGKDVKIPVNAIEKTLNVIQAIKEWAPKYKSKHLYMGQEATNVTVISIEAGHPWRPTKVAPYSRIYVEIDTIAGQQTLAVIDEFADLIRSFREKDPELSIDYRVIQTATGSEVSREELGVILLSKCHKRIHGKDPLVTFDSWHADTDTFVRHGIPSVCYGPQGRSRYGGANYYPREGEHCNLDDLVQGAKVMTLMASEMCTITREDFRAKAPKDRKSLVF
jgi:acetylornithine deacetylase/succinyl-diaminopimelate desuccinylase-like protein